MPKSLLAGGALAGASASLVWVAGVSVASESRPPAASRESPVVALGRRLFLDPSVSRSGAHACAC